MDMLRQRLVATWAEFQHCVVYYVTEHSAYSESVSRCRCDTGVLGSRHRGGPVTSGSPPGVDPKCPPVDRSRGLSARRRRVVYHHDDVAWCSAVNRSTSRSLDDVDWHHFPRRNTSTNILGQLIYFRDVGAATLMIS